MASAIASAIATLLRAAEPVDMGGAMALQPAAGIATAAGSAFIEAAAASSSSASALLVSCSSASCLARSFNRSNRASASLVAFASASRFTAAAETFACASSFAACPESCFNRSSSTSRSNVSDAAAVARLLLPRMAAMLACCGKS
jgi:hypothetical protein